MAENLKLFRNWSSPWGLRVVHALKIKGIQYETILEDLSNKSDLLLEYNPVYKKVPVILEYIDETWKQRPLLPRDPYDKAMARFWARFGDDKILPSVKTALVSQGKEQEEALFTAIDNLKFIEELLKGKKFFGGDTINYLNIAFGWMAITIRIVEEIVNLKIVNAEKFQLLSAWMNYFLDDPLIKEWLPPRDKMVEKFKGMRELYLKQDV